MFFIPTGEYPKPDDIETDGEAEMDNDFLLLISFSSTKSAVPVLELDCFRDSAATLFYL